MFFKDGRQTPVGIYSKKLAQVDVRAICGGKIKNHLRIFEDQIGQDFKNHEAQVWLMLFL